MTDAEYHEATLKKKAELFERKQLYESLAYKPIYETVKEHTNDIAGIRFVAKCQSEDIAKLQKQLRRKDEAVKEIQAWMQLYNERVPQGFWQRLQWLFFGKRW